MEKVQSELIKKILGYGHHIGIHFDSDYYNIKNEDELVPQGIEGMVPFSGSISKVIKQYCGGLQASLGYCGTKNINLLQKNGKFIRISNAGAIEAHAHDVKITKEAPNYRR